MSELPKIKMKGKVYYFDERLREIRNVENPHDYYDLTSEEVMGFSMILAASEGCLVTVHQKDVKQFFASRAPRDERI